MESAHEHDTVVKGGCFVASRQVEFTNQPRWMATFTDKVTVFMQVWCGKGTLKGTAEPMFRLCKAATLSEAKRLGK